MPRFPRVVAIGLPHHVTQRGNARRTVFETDADRFVYLDLLQANCLLYHLSVLGFCLMSNHVHLVVVPERSESLGTAFRYAHCRYASYLNARQNATGHVWQGRYYSCPLDTTHLWVALRYIERNPVRAGLAPAPDRYRWSSAAAHCGHAVAQLPLPLDDALWSASWNTASWSEFLKQAGSAEDTEMLRTHTHTGRPLGSADFVEHLERVLHRTLAPQKGGRPRKLDENSAQTAFTF